MIGSGHSIYLAALHATRSLRPPGIVTEPFSEGITLRTRRSLRTSIPMSIRTMSRKPRVKNFSHRSLATAAVTAPPPSPAHLARQNLGGQLEVLQ